MDNRTGEMDVFLRVAEHGSFAAAARRLRLTPSAVSRSIARLEARLGVRLLQRTTRSLQLTAEGEAYRLRAQALMQEFEALERSFASERAEPRGRLRVSVSVPFGLHCLLPVVPAFLERYPRISLDLSLSDTLVDLVHERTDVAIRHGPLRDSTLRARKLGSSRWLVVASPDYLRRHGRPQKPSDLDQHNGLNFNFRRSVEGWTFLLDGESKQRQISGNFYGNSGEALRLMAVGGAGIARLAWFLVSADVRAGRLVPLLDDCMPRASEDIHAIYTGQGQPSPRVRAFIDFMAAQIAIDGDDAPA